MSISATPIAPAHGFHTRLRLPRPVSALEGSVGFVSTFPPTKCGLATFTASLAGALGATGPIGVVSCVDERGETVSSPGVVAEWVRGSRSSLAGAAQALSAYDTVVVQHEFGLFGGEDGADILELVSLLDAPVVVVLHTVLESPSPNQRRIVEELARVASRIVVQSEVAGRRLLGAHRIDSSSVVVIPHGAPANLAPLALRPDPTRRPSILTWGLIGPGKGIEFAIEALAELKDLTPLPRYVVLGETHPNVRKHSGEAYRESLQALSETLGVEHMIEFLDGYRDTAAVLAEVRRADIVLLPYRSRDQVVSGVLVEAIGSGKPVVSTAFPHAVELLSGGAGVVVPHEDPAAIAAALRMLLTDPAAAARAAAAARRQAVSLTWENVGVRYRQVTRGLQPAGAVSAL
ncbi:MAG TPA: glycosyltransferase [Gaiellaceae bacterium]|nr:glycosyltransferase [Gaiellaceae bacterium]